MIKIARLIWTWFLSVVASAFASADNCNRFEARTFADGDYKLNYRLLKPKTVDG